MSQLDSNLVLRKSQPRNEVFTKVTKLVFSEYPQACLRGSNGCTLGTPVYPNESSNCTKDLKIWSFYMIWKYEFTQFLELSLRDILKKFVFLLHKTFRPSLWITFSLSEWQEVAPFFWRNQNKTSWRLIWALLQTSTLTNSMFSIAKTFVFIWSYRISFFSQIDLLHCYSIFKPSHQFLVIQTSWIGKHHWHYLFFHIRILRI